VKSYAYPLALLMTFMFMGNAFADTKPPDTNNTSQEEFLLLDIEKLDEVMGITKIDENGQELTYRLRRLDGVVDHITRHTNDNDHGHGEDYPLWREHLRKPHPTVETFKYFFAQAAQEFGVPVEILEAIGHVESNWTQIGPSIDRGWGVMHLVQNNYADTLGEAAIVLDIDPQVLKDDAQQNIRGAAALIAHYAGEPRHIFTQLEDWFEAVKQFTGLINDELREMQALRYYEVIKTGAESQTLWGETITLTSHSNISLTPDPVSRARTLRNTRTADYALAVSNLTSCNYTSSSNRTIDTWVNHWIGTGTYAGAISWFHNCNAKTSAHFIVRASDGQITQLVQIKDIAWHAGNWSYNQRSIGVEHEVTVANSGGWNTTWTTEMLKASAKMARHFADKYSIPKTRSTTPGILGHNEIKSTTCPGTLPWNDWMNYFNNVAVPSANIPIIQSPIDGSQGQGASIEFAWDNNNVFSNIASVEFTLRKVAGNYSGAAKGDYVGSCGRIVDGKGRGIPIGVKDNYSSALCGEELEPNQWYKWAVSLYFNNGANPSGFSAFFKTQDVTLPSSDYTWHGNGSIISYHGRLLSNNAGEDWPYGITQDVVQLHASTNKPVGFFQWQVNEDGCRNLKLDTDGLSSNVDITIGSWRNRDDDITFSNVQLPLVLGRSNTGYRFEMNNGSWYVVKVASRNSLSSDVQLNAYCTTASPTNVSYRLGGGDAVLMDGGYKWNGNASVISHLFRDLYSRRYENLGNDWPFGAFKDTLKVRRSSEKPVVFFQWQRDDVCSSLTFDAELSSGEKRVDIHVKNWSASNESATVHSSVTLPYTIYDSSNNGNWRVIQIKFQKPISYTANVTAKCSGMD